MSDARALPAPLPPGEHLLWQGGPAWWPLARRAFHVRKVAGYFALLLVARMALLAAEGAGLAATLEGGAILAAVGASAVALLALLAWLNARSTFYTITSRRLVMRFGVALPITINIPYTIVTNAGRRLYKDGTADIPLELSGNGRIAWLHLWPHARPWYIGRPQPMLRTVPDGRRVASMLADALAATTAATGAAVQPATPARERSPAALEVAERVRRGASLARAA